ncbi:MAG: hypothetical protein ACK5NA_08360 [Enterococcus sp.]
MNKNFNLATLGIFSLFCVLVLLISRIIKKEPFYDILGVLVAQTGVLSMSEYIQNKKIVFLIIGAILLSIGVVFFSKYINR